MNYTVPKNSSPNKIFITKRSELEGRFDANYCRENLNFQDTIKLSKIARIKGGKRIPLGYDYSNSETANLYLRVANMSDNEDFRFEEFRFISDELYSILSRYEVFNNDLIISIAGTIGKIKMLSNIPEGKRIILTENCAKIVITEDNVLPAYLLLLLETSFVQKQISLSYIQTTIPKLGLDKIGSLRLPSFPDVSTQKEIITLYQNAYTQKQQKEAEAKLLLASIDAYLLSELGITIPQKDNSLQNRIFTTSYTEVQGNRIDSYFYQKDFLEFFANLKNASYPVLSLKKIAKRITSGITPLSGGDAYTSSTEGIPFIRSGNIDISGDLNFEDLLYLKEDVHFITMKSSQLKYNDLMIAIVGATIGQVGIYKSDREANINQAIALVRLHPNHNPDFVKELIKSSIGQYNLNRLKRPVARANINLEEISTMTLVIPPIEKQNEIAAKIANIRIEAKKLYREADDILTKSKLLIEGKILGV